MSVLVKIKKNIESYEIESGPKTFADFLDYDFLDRRGTSATLYGKFSAGVDTGEKIFIVATNNKTYVTSTTAPTDEQLKTDWYILDVLTVADVNGDKIASFSIEDVEMDSFSFAMYKQGAPSFVSSGEIDLG